jgi:hypothetical protein
VTVDGALHADEYRYGGIMEISPTIRESSAKIVRLSIIFDYKFVFFNNADLMMIN